MLVFKVHGQDSKRGGCRSETKPFRQRQKKIWQTTPAIQITQSDERAHTRLKKSQKASWKRVDD